MCGPSSDHKDEKWMEETQGAHAFPSIQRPFLKMKGQAYRSASEVVQIQKRVVGPDKENEE